MTRSRIRKRFIVAVEGEGEQSFIRWLQHLSDEKQMFIHLDCKLLGGGGYRSMLAKAVSYCKRKEKSVTECSILLVDADRAIVSDDGWSLEELRINSHNKKIQVILQCPNLEGIYLRMLSKSIIYEPTPGDVVKRLRKEWQSYKKPVDAQTLISKFKADDLYRAATGSPELKNLLTILGLF